MLLDAEEEGIVNEDIMEISNDENMDDDGGNDVKPSSGYYIGKPTNGNHVISYISTHFYHHFTQTS